MIQLVLQQARGQARLSERREVHASLDHGARLLEQLPRPDHPENHFVFDHTQALGGIGDPAAMPALIKALKDPRDDVRGAAARALGEIKDPKAVPALIEALKDNSIFAHSMAVEALEKIKDPAAVPALSRVLSDHNNRVRSAALWAIGSIRQQTKAET